ncbi:MAG: hypothetical protein ACI3VB_05095 [Oscillospiraceae bacterium]
MSVSFGGVGCVTATFKTIGTVAEGSPVKMQDDGTVKACASGERFCGIALFAAEDGHAAVQLKGFVSCGVTGSVSVGYSRLVADGAGGVKADTGSTGGEYLIVDTGVSGRAGFIM